MPQAGCTAVVAVVKGSELWVANAGDSRAVLCRGGQALALSEDHKPQSETERNRITAAGGFVSDVGGVSRLETSASSYLVTVMKLLNHTASGDLSWTYVCCLLPSTDQNPMPNTVAELYQGGSLCSYWLQKHAMCAG